MSQHLERLLPILSIIPGVNIPASLMQGAYIAASQRKIEQLERALRYEVGLLNQKIEAGKLRLDQEYVKSESFTANVMQTLRAAEIAESEDKLKIIAQALMGCATELHTNHLNKTLCMRVISQITAEEVKLLAQLITIEGNLVDFYRPVLESILQKSNLNASALIIGLTQLGMTEIRSVSAQPRKWSSTPLARQVVELCTLVDTV